MLGFLATSSENQYSQQGGEERRGKKFFCEKAHSQNWTIIIIMQRLF